MELRSGWRELCLRIFLNVLFFVLCNLEKNVSKMHLKFPVFYNKIKTRAYQKNLRHSSLQSYVFDISEKFQYQVCNIKREILGQKIKVKDIA